MFGALKTVEEKNLYSSFGLTDGLSDCELEDINGGWCVNFTVTICSGNGNGNDSGNGNGSVTLVVHQVLVPAHLVVRHS